MRRKIYLDNNATTALDPFVFDVLMEDLKAPPSNPSAAHSWGQEAKIKLVKARSSIASFFGVKQQEIIFTSSGTESMNLLLRGLIDPAEKPHVITSNIEHSCVQKTLLDLETKGCSVSFLPAGTKGHVSHDELRKAITAETRFLVFSAANSETGVKHDLDAFSKISLETGIPLIIDAIGHFGKDSFSLYPGILAAGFSAHKFHGPKGIGFIFFRSTAKHRLKPLFTGGGQEYGIRSGTENLSGILGLAEAINQVEIQSSQSFEKMKVLRDLFEEKLMSLFDFVKINGEGKRVSNVSNLCFEGVDAETLLIQLDLHGVAASHGSACSSGALEPSRILTSMGLSHTQAKSSVRFSLSRFTTEEEILQVVNLLNALLPKLKV